MSIVYLSEMHSRGSELLVLALGSDMRGLFMAWYEWIVQLSFVK